MIRMVQSLILLAALVLLNCGGEKTEPVKTFDMSRVVATVDGKQLNLTDLNTMIKNKGWIENTGLKRVTDTAEFNFKALDALIIDELVNEAADTFDIDTIFGAQTRIRDHQMAFVLKLMRNDLMNEVPEITDEEVDSFYESNKSRFFSPMSANAEQIMISTNPRFWDDYGEDLSSVSEDSMDVLARAKMSEVIEKLDGGESFEELAKAYSHDKSSGQNGGSLGWIALGQSPDIFDSTLFSLKPGEVSPAIHTEYGYHLIKLIEIRDSSYTPLDDVLRADIKQGLLMQRQREYTIHFMDSLKNAADVRYNRKVLARPDTTFKPMEWLAIVNNRDTIYAYDFAEFARTYRLKNRLSDFTADQKITALDGFVANRVLVNEARKRGYFEREETAKDLDHFKVLQKRHQYRLLGQAKLWEPTDEEIKAFYDAHLEDYFDSKPLYVQHILFEDSLKAEKVRQKIEDGADFREMALKYYPGDKAVRESLFDLGYISRDEMPPEFWNAASILSPGDVSRPIKTKYGYHLIKLVDRKPSVSFKDAKLRVRKRMMDERRDSVFQTWRTALLKGHKIDVDSALVREFVFQMDVQKMPETSQDSVSATN